MVALSHALTVELFLKKPGVAEIHVRRTGRREVFVRKEWGGDSRLQGTSRTKCVANRKTRRDPRDLHVTRALICVSLVVWIERGTG